MANTTHAPQDSSSSRKESDKRLHSDPTGATDELSAAEINELPKRSITSIMSFWKLFNVVLKFLEELAKREKRAAVHVLFTIVSLKSLSGSTHLVKKAIS